MSGKNKGGRPTKYREEYAGQVYKLCLLGAIDEELADFFEVSVQTIHNWTDAHPEFLEARKKGKEAADARVAEALFHRALGYQHQAVKIMSYEGSSWEHEYVKRYPPDTAAAFIWLKNRQPDKWRDKQEVEHSGSVSFSEMSDEELIERARQTTNRLAALQANGNGNGNGKR